MRAQINERDFEQLSAYMDGQLAPAEQRRLEERLRARPDLQEALEDLRRTRALLRSAPRRRAPRNFTLTPAMVGEQAGRRKGGFFSNLFPTLSFASAVATLLLVATLLFDLAPGLTPATVAESPAAVEDARLMQKDGENAGPAAGAAPQMEAAPAAPSITSNSEGADAGPVILWGPNGYGGAVGMGGGGAPDVAWGRGGGGAEMGGMGGGSAGPLGADPYNTGEIIVPQESVDSMPQTYAVPEAVQPDPSITGAGPILGVAPTEQTGQIVEREVINQGLPVEQQPAPVLGDSPPPQPVMEPEQRILGLPPIRLAQIALAVLAVVTGLAAFLLRRR